MERSKFKKCKGLKINQKKKNCVFMSFYTYSNKKHKHIRERKPVPIVLLQMRWDGQIGFPGGKVEYDDYKGNLNEFTLKKALIRELKEEINLKQRLDFNKIEHLSTFESNTLCIHNFSYYLEEKEFLELFINSNNHKNIEENTGCILCYLYNFGRGKGYGQFIKNNFKATSLQELRMLNYKLLKSRKNKIS